MKRVIAGIMAALIGTAMITVPANAVQVCMDGWISYTEPGTRGACSWHGGVNKWASVPVREAPKPEPVRDDRCPEGTHYRAVQNQWWGLIENCILDGWTDQMLNDNPTVWIDLPEYKYPIQVSR